MFAVAVTDLCVQLTCTLIPQGAVVRGCVCSVHSSDAVHVHVHGLEGLTQQQVQRQDCAACVALTRERTAAADPAATARICALCACAVD